MFSVFELGKGIGGRSVFGTPDNWEGNGELRWPPQTKKMNIFRKSRAEPEENWESTRDYKVLARNLRKYVCFKLRLGIFFYFFHLKLLSRLVWRKRRCWRFIVTPTQWKKPRKRKR